MRRRSIGTHGLEAHATFALALFALGLVACGDAWANSYDFAPIMKKDLPSGVAVLAQWTFDVEDNDEARSKIQMDISTLEHFLQHGRWQFQFPLYAAEKKLTEEFRTRTKGLLFDDDPEWKIEQKRHQERIENVRLRYGGLPAGLMIGGAFRSGDGRHFRWHLCSPLLLRLELGQGGRCYLELSDETAVDLEKLVAEKDTAKLIDEEIARPDLPTGEWKLSPDSLPATGKNRRLPQSLIEDFCRNGKRADGPWFRTKSKCRFVTTLWFPEFKKHLEKYPPLPSDDGRGNFVIGGYGDGSFAVIFEDSKKKLWRARLLSDACLLLENSKGQGVFLQHSAVIKGGSGQTFAERKSK